MLLPRRRRRMKMARIKNMKTIDLKIAENEENLRKLALICFFNLSKSTIIVFFVVNVSVSLSFIILMHISLPSEIALRMLSSCDSSKLV